MSRKDKARKILKRLEDNKPSFARIGCEKEITTFITTLRSILSNPHLKKWKRYPKEDAIYKTLVKIDGLLKDWVKEIIERDADTSNQAIRVIRDGMLSFCAWPERYNKSYDDSHPKLDKDGKPMMRRIEWCNWDLKERRKEMRDKTSSDLIDSSMEWRPEKEEERLYNKYVKECKKHND